MLHVPLLSLVWRIAGFAVIAWMPLGDLDIIADE